MAYRSNPNDPFITPPPADDFTRRVDPLRPADRLEAAGSVSATRVAIYAVAVLALVGALFYGMSTATNETASNPPANSMAQRPAPAPPPVRDVTPRNNTESGVTTGAAPTQPAPAGSTKQ